MERKIGDVVAEFESGRRGVFSISSGRGDPGGKSYGKYQLASKVGTLQAWLRSSRYKQEFAGVPLAGGSFDKIYLKIAHREPEELEYDQWKFIKRTHYDPVRDMADVLGIDSTPSINEFLWSSSVQHSRKGNRSILSRVPNNLSERATLSALFESRKRYVHGLRSLPSATQRAVLNRYEREEAKIVRELIEK